MNEHLGAVWRVAVAAPVHNHHAIISIIVSISSIATIDSYVSQCNAFYDQLITDLRLQTLNFDNTIHFR